MASKKKRKFLNVILSALMLLGVGTAQSNAEYGVNGVTYVLLPTETANPGVFRLNNKDGSNTSPWKLFRISDLTAKGKVSGLAANQENKVFLLTANAKSDKDFKLAEPGWMPAGIKFDDDSAIYLAAASPSDGGATDYIRSGCPHGPYSASFPANDSSLYIFWYKNVTLNGHTYKYVCRFNGPKGVKFLDGVSGLRGTPIWDGTEYSSSNPYGAIKHPKYSDSSSKHYKKIILPSHMGAVSYYLYGTRNEKAIEGKCMNGEGGRDKYVFTASHGSGYFYKDSKHGNGTMFCCIVKRFYDKRESGLDLYSKDDKTTASSHPTESFSTGNLDKANVLKTVDVRVREAYGKVCGDNCIDGGEIAGGNVETALSTVTVVTTTKGNRYGFNPLGERYLNSSNKADAALRVVPYTGSEDVINIASNKNETSWNGRITNQSYLNARGITPKTLSCIGVSSNFEGNDYVYGSGADYFVVQDSWWGKGGIAYEYYKPSGGKSGFVRKIDYMNKATQTSYTDLGDVSGDLDAIGIDGNGYFYTLVTEQDPTDGAMKNISVPSGQVSSVSGFNITYSEWRRDKFKTVNGEKVNDGYDVIADGKQKKGDYRLATILQPVYKTVYRYGISNGTSLNSSKKERVGSGRLLAGYDLWTNNLTCTKDNTNNVSFSFSQWQEDKGSKVSTVPCELAVVNIADSPKVIPGTDNHYVVVTKRKNSGGTDVSYSAGQVVQENDTLTFKVEGYKPKIDGVQRELTSVGNVSSTLKNVYINNIPGKTFLNDRYEHDEDNDGYYSGFPSTMFEATNYATQVTWKVAQVEDTYAPSSMSTAKIIKSYPDKIVSSSAVGNYAELTHQFKDPGRYLIQATVIYNVFTNYGKASRPDKLTVGKASFVTKPRLITVYANSLNLNRTPSFITNIKMTPIDRSKRSGQTNGKYDSNNNDLGRKQAGLGSSDGVYGSSGDTFDTAEGKPDADRHFGDLRISFDAQFARETNVESTSNLMTYDGIGVWDYAYYRNLYKNKGSLYGVNFVDPFVAISSAKAKSSTVDPENILGKVNVSSPQHVYNYNVGLTSLTNSYKVDVYNPGRYKEKSTYGTYQAGTEVDKLKDMDKAYIKWALYLRPVYPQGEVSTGAMYDRGQLLANGTCATATFSLIGDRKYTVTFDIVDIDSKINVPRDPKNYTVDFELVYPRITWLNNQLTTSPSGSDKYYSSIVPYVDSGSSPIHVLSRLKLYGSDMYVNQSYDGVFKTYPTFTLNVRDREKPKFADNTESIPYLETTGEAPVTTGIFNYQIKDNNPFMMFVTNNSTPSKTSIKYITDADARNNGLKLYLERIKGTTFDETNNAGMVYKPAESRSNVISIKQLCNNDKSNAASLNNFYTYDDYNLSVDYKNTVNNLSDFTAGDGKYYTIEDIKKGKAINKWDWVGLLNYAVTGRVYDGFGIGSKSNPSSTNVVHGLYDSTVAGITDIYGGQPTSSIIDANDTSNPPSKDANGVGVNPYLQRIDNDPPSIGVTLISQSDNRRWNYQLLEGNTDKERLPSVASKLADSQLIIKQYELQRPNTTSGTGYGPALVSGSGSTNNYLVSGKLIEQNTKPLGKASINLEEIKAAPVASFKHSSRLIINVDIFDNCGFKKLSDANITVTDSLTGNILPVTNINCVESHNFNGTIKNFANEPRGSFALDLPMKIAETQPQVTVTVKAKELIIPVSILENTFDIRVLETKEHKE